MKAEQIVRAVASDGGFALSPRQVEVALPCGTTVRPLTLAIATQRYLAGLGADATSSDGRPKAELAYGFAALTLMEAA